MSPKDFTISSSSCCVKPRFLLVDSLLVLPLTPIVQGVIEGCTLVDQDIGGATPLQQDLVQRISFLLVIKEAAAVNATAGHAQIKDIMTR